MTDFEMQPLRTTLPSGKAVEIWPERTLGAAALDGSRTRIWFEFDGLIEAVEWNAEVEQVRAVLGIEIDDDDD